MANIDELKPLLDLYAATVFLCPQSIPLETFAIVTAYNPKGKLLTDEENSQKNQLLKTKLKSKEYFQIIGASPDFVHQEPSFAINISKSAAIKLAISFDQNAIFWVQRGIVSLEPALLKFGSITMGSFNAKVKIEKAGKSRL